MSKTVTVNVTYTDDKNKYDETYNIDLSSFSWQLLCSPEDTEYELKKKQQKTFDKIEKTLSKIEKNIKKEQNNG